MDVEIPDVEILNTPSPKPRNTRYTGRVSKTCAMRGGHDWGRVPVLREFDPRGKNGFRPGDVCAICGKKRFRRIDWDIADRPPFDIHITPRKYQDRSRYDSSGRKNRGARRG